MARQQLKGKCRTLNQALCGPLSLDDGSPHGSRDLSEVSYFRGAGRRCAAPQIERWLELEGVFAIQGSATWSWAANWTGNWAADLHVSSLGIRGCRVFAGERGLGATRGAAYLG